MILDYEHQLMQRVGLSLLGLVLILCAVLSMTGCRGAIADRGTVFTEEGIRAAAGQWDVQYYRKLEECKAAGHLPMTRGAEECFGPTFDADAKVSQAVTMAVLALRTYWTARAAGESPDWKRTLAEVLEILRALPPEAKQYFDRVKGIAR